MLRRIIFILLPLLVPLGRDGNFIEWDSARKLTWSDFKGAPDPSSPNAALTNSAILIDFGYNNKGLTYSIKCRFNKSLSWARIRNDYILAHEQLHFDIAEVHARMLNKALGEYTFNGRTVGNDVNAIYQRVMQRHVQTQQDYDRQTNHSLDTAAQTAWNKRIAALLEEYGKFSNYGSE